MAVYGHMVPLIRGADIGERVIYSVIVVIGAVLWWLSKSHPALVPFWAPWDSHRPRTW
jgi:hypothetical protein